MGRHCDMAKEYKDELTRTSEDYQRRRSTDSCTHKNTDTHYNKRIYKVF
jgi:hypothetical protein